MTAPLFNGNPALPTRNGLYGLGLPEPTAGAINRVLGGLVDPSTIPSAMLRHVDPPLDVSVCIFLNAAVWMIGVMLSYVAHDVDPEFMEATLQHRRDGRRYNNARRSLTHVMDGLEQQCSRQVMQLQVETLSRSAEVARERGQYAQVAARDKVVTAAIVESARSTVRQYRDLLAQHILENGQIQILFGGPDSTRELTAYDFMASDIVLDDSVITTASHYSAPASLR